jgi:hypothetical protein
VVEASAYFTPPFLATVERRKRRTTPSKAPSTCIATGPTLTEFFVLKPIATKNAAGDCAVDLDAVKRSRSRARWKIGSRSYCDRATTPALQTIAEEEVIIPALSTCATRLHITRWPHARQELRRGERSLPCSSALSITLGACTTPAPPPTIELKARPTSPKLARRSASEDLYGNHPAPADPRLAAPAWDEQAPSLRQRSTTNPN